MLTACGAVRCYSGGAQPSAPNGDGHTGVKGGKQGDARCGVDDVSSWHPLLE